MGQDGHPGKPVVNGFDNFEHASITDVGVRRSHNQDYHAVSLASDTRQWLEHGHVFLVADGMGAHAVGELASELAGGIIPHTYHKHAKDGAATALRKAFIEANASIHAKGQQNREFEGMGTTGTALLLRADGAWIGHVGDSRAYRVRGDHIEQLSFDHSLIWEYARRQRIDPDQVQGIPSNVIIRSLGPEPLVQVDIEGPHPVEDGDIFVLCSDGLSGQVPDNEIGAIASLMPPTEACRFLVDLANLRGGPDNITIVIVKLGDRAGTALPPLPRRALYERIPWPLASLCFGILMAAGALTFTYYHMALGVPVFLLAALAIVVGLIGLLLQHERERRQAADELPLPPLRVHRHASCRVDRPLIDKFIRATEMLRQRVEEKKWETDWDTFHQHHDQAAKLLAQNDLEAAFLGYCRTLGPLSVALHRQRNKEEVFKPLWDTEPNRLNGEQQRPSAAGDNPPGGPPASKHPDDEFI
jgi:protein phosphatase